MREIIVDNFAGGGGASTGIELAIGRSVDIAINHDENAIAMHKTNHPDTLHYCESVFDVDPVAATGGNPVGLAWFSPDCRHFSKAKGAKPVKKEIRGLAWIVLRWALAKRPRVMMLENVEEFKTWGPLLADEMRPDPARTGETFNAFVGMLSTGIPADHPALAEVCEFLSIERGSEQAQKLVDGLGYDVDYRELRACDYGAPTIRKRFFMVMRCDGCPIQWPAVTHGDPKSLEVQSGRLMPWRTAAECIDWNVPALSIFDRKKPLSELVAAGDQFNLQHITLAGYEKDTQTPADELAASRTARAAVFIRNDPARPTQTGELVDMLPAPKGKRFTTTEQQTLLSHGVATAYVESGVLRIQRDITTYRKNAYGVADNSYLDSETLHTSAYVLRRLKSVITSKYGRHKLANDGTRFGPGQAIVTPAVIRGELGSTYRQLEREGIVENFDLFQQHLIVERNANDSNRLDVLFPPDYVNQLRVFAVLNQFRLQYSEEAA